LLSTLPKQYRLSRKNMRQKVIMDVDTGCDDAVAMLLAG
jgi:hypothetical protein